MSDKNAPQLWYKMGKGIDLMDFVIFFPMTFTA